MIGTRDASITRSGKPWPCSDACAHVVCNTRLVSELAMTSKRSELDQNVSSAKKKRKRLCSFSSSWLWVKNLKSSTTDKPKVTLEIFFLGRMATSWHFAKSARCPSSFHTEVHRTYAGILKALATTTRWILLERQPGGYSRKAKAARE